MENEAIKILSEKRKLLQQMIDSGVGGATDEGELFKVELKQRLSDIDTALNLIVANPLLVSTSEFTNENNKKENSEVALPRCPKCGAQIFDPFVGKKIIHNISECRGNGN